MLWLIERREGSDRAAAALMVKKCPQLQALKRHPNNDIHKVLINWRAQLRDNVGNKYVARVLKSEIAKFEQRALTPARALELGLSRLQGLGRMIDRLPLGFSASPVTKTGSKVSAPDPI
jgi:hypothetical protein